MPLELKKSVILNLIRKKLEFQKFFVVKRVKFFVHCNGLKMRAIVNPDFSNNNLLVH
jgi:hypothetical protein